MAKEGAVGNSSHLLRDLKLSNLF